jgi:UDP-N-acetyl-D-glucosamine dehydrogenase
MSAASLGPCNKKIVIVGQGYVGLPLAMQAVQAGYQVVGLEADPRRVAQLELGVSFIEDVPSADIRRALATGRYLPTLDVAACRGFVVAAITVPTPLKDGVPDLSYVRAAAETLADLLQVGATVILESTTYPGTTEEIVQPLLEGGSGLVAGRDFHLGFSPERIDPGNAIWNTKNTPKIVSGIDARSLTEIQAFYDTLVDITVAVSGTREAELAKLLENTFRQVNIALVNEIAIYAAATKPFGFMRFTPGPGVGGHCLPIDPSYLSWRVRLRLGEAFRFVELANDINEHMPSYVVRRLGEALNLRKRSVNGCSVLLLGLTYKKNTSDARQSPAMRVAELLVGLGASVRASDPHLLHGQIPPGVEMVKITDDQLMSADAVILLVDHDEFADPIVVEHATYILDTRHQLSGAGVEYL